MFDLSTVIRKLAAQRPIFHSEADFQHALAWKLHEAYAEASIRLEYRPMPDEALYTDIWLQHDSGAVAIELKYVTRRLDTVHAGERFVLANHGAQPLRRYDFLKDIARLEQVTATHSNASGFAVMLTNESAYWRPSLGRDTTDAAFRIHDGQTLQGIVSWSDGASSGMTRRRDVPLSFRKSYAIRWSDYASPDTGPAGRFRYVLVEVSNR